QLTLRYTGRDGSPESEATKVKQVEGVGDSTEVKKFFLQEDGTLGSGETFVKGFSHGGSSPVSESKDGGGRWAKQSPSMTSVKQAAGSLDWHQTQRKVIDGDGASIKQDGQFETYVKEVYVKDASFSSEGSSIPSSSNNGTPMDSSVPRDGELGLSESVITHPPGTFDDLDLAMFTQMSGGAAKLPISLENIHQQVSDTKTLPDKDMSQHHCRQPDPCQDLHLPSPGPANVPNLSLLDAGSSRAGHHDDDPLGPDLSIDSNFSVAERKQNNLNCISVSTATSLFKANCVATPLSLAERMQYTPRDGSPVDGEKSISNNQILDGGDGFHRDRHHGPAGCDGRDIGHGDGRDIGHGDGRDIGHGDGMAYAEDNPDHKHENIPDDASGAGDGPHDDMDVSDVRRCDQQTAVKSLPACGAGVAESFPVRAPPMKRQRSNNHCPWDGSRQLLEMRMSPSEGTSVGEETAEPELGLELGPV
ncbi:hypothetical protein EGW08_007810, partial [Elysia chlorotica]